MDQCSVLTIVNCEVHGTHNNHAMCMVVKESISDGTIDNDNDADNGQHVAPSGLLMVMMRMMMMMIMMMMMMMMMMMIMMMMTGMMMMTTDGGTINGQRQF